jgi:Xaa-Pro aminopeptidase
MRTARVIVADSEHDANMLYATHLFVPDPFIYFELGGKTHVVMSDLEFDRAKKNAAVDRVLPLTRYVNALKRTGLKAPRLGDLLAAVLDEFHVKIIEVPASFPIGLAKKLRGVRIKVKPDPFFPEREIKEPAEINKLAAALRLAEIGMQSAIKVIKMSRVRQDGFLYWRGHKLTSEHVQGVINATIAGLGGNAPQTIVAGGNQACDPHETGHGPLRAHQTIIIDIFPRDAKTGYWGDITRTIVRGRAREKVKHIYALVAQAQDLAFTKLRAGVNGHDVHNAIQQLFARAGLTTGRRNGRMQGFFHGTGHGLGLEIHESPRVSAVDATLRKDHVVTVEPGLYYHGLGGVRLEDVAVIGERGARNLTRFPKFLEV